MATSSDATTTSGISTSLMLTFSAASRSATSGGHAFLRPSTQVLGEGSSRSRVNMARRFYAADEAVAFVLRQHVFHRAFEFAQAHHDLLGFRLLHPRVVRALDDEERRFDVLGVEEGGL